MVSELTNALSSFHRSHSRSNFLLPGCNSDHICSNSYHWTRTACKGLNLNNHFEACRSPKLISDISVIASANLPFSFSYYVLKLYVEIVIIGIV